MNDSMTTKHLMKTIANQMTDEDSAVLIAAKNGNIKQCAMTGENDEVIANLTVALTLALGSIKDPVQRLQTKQTVSTAIMTKDVDLDALKKKGGPRMKCVICGDWFPDAMVTCPVKNGETPKIFPKELCDGCADKSGAYRKAVPRSYPAAPVDGYLTIAGAIERRVLEEYRRSYADALTASQRTDCVCTDEECAFLALHRRVSESQYHAALTLSNIRELLDGARREAQRDFPEFRQKDGLHHIRKRWYWYNRMMENQKQQGGTK